MTKGNSPKFRYKAEGSGLTITTWDDVEKVEICSLGKVFVIVVGVLWRGVVGIRVQCLLQCRGREVSNELSRSNFRQKWFFSHRVETPHHGTWGCQELS